MSEIASIVSMFASALALLLCAIFLHAGWSKLRPQNKAYYMDAIENYGLTPTAWSPRLPLLIGSCECLIGLLILLPFTRQFGLLLAALILFVYLLAFAKQLRQGKADMDCGCAGPGSSVKVGPMLLVRNIVLILLALFSSLSAQLVEPAQWPLVLLLAAIVMLVYSSIEQLMANRQKIQALQQANG